MNNTYYEKSRFKAHELMEAKLSFNDHCLKFVGHYGTLSAAFLDDAIKGERLTTKHLWDTRYRKDFSTDVVFGADVGLEIFGADTYRVFRREALRTSAYKLFYLKKMRRVVNKLCAQLDKVTSGSYQKGNPTPLSVTQAPAPVKVDSLIGKGLGGFGLDELHKIVAPPGVDNVLSFDKAEEEPVVDLRPDWFVRQMEEK